MVTGNFVPRPPEGGLSDRKVNRLERDSLQFAVATSSHSDVHCPQGNSSTTTREKVVKPLDRLVQVS